MSELIKLPPNNKTRLKVFVSHANEDIEKLISLEKSFAFHGIDCFLAHRDIDNGSWWQEEIQEKLKNCDIFLLFATKNSKKSSFCNQEIGGATLLGKPIVILGDGSSPFHWDMLPEIQGSKITDENIFFKLMKEISLKVDENKFKEMKMVRKLGRYEGIMVHPTVPKNETERNNIANKFPDNTITLLPNDWNDDGYRSTFCVYLGKALCCSIKICHKNQTYDYVHTNMPSQFLWLDSNFVSNMSIDESDLSNKDEAMVSEALPYLLRSYKSDKTFAKGFEDNDAVKKSMFRKATLIGIDSEEYEKFRTLNKPNNEKSKNKESDIIDLNDPHASMDIDF